MTKTETLLTFPCDFTLKVFGNHNEEFEQTIIGIVKQHCNNLKENAFQHRPSSDGKYMAISVSVHVDSKEQLDAIYKDLSSNPQVLMVL